MKLSGIRSDEAQWLLTLRRGKVIDAETYRSGIAKLEKAEKKVQEKEEKKAVAAAVKKIREEFAKGIKEGRKRIAAERKAKKEATKKARAPVRVEKVLFTMPNNLKAYTLENSLLYGWFEEGLGGTVAWDTLKTSDKQLYIRVNADGRTTTTAVTEDMRKDYGKFRAQFFVGGGSDAEECILIENKTSSRPSTVNGAKVFKSKWVVIGSYEIIEEEFIVPKKSVQKYRDGGEKHCVLDPLISQFSLDYEKAPSQGSKDRIMRKIRLMNGLKAVYPSGVPEDKMEEVAKQAQCCFELENVIGDVYATYNSRSTRNFKWFNPRLNHLEVGVLDNNEPLVVDSFDALYAKYMEAVDAGEFAMVEGHRQEKYTEVKEIRKITKTGLNCRKIVVDKKRDIFTQLHMSGRSFKFEDKNADVFRSFNESIGLDAVKYDALKHPEMYSFIKDGCVVNGWCTMINPEVVADSHLDLKNAYVAAQEYFRGKPEYQGFLGRITRFAGLAGVDNSFISENVGIYQVLVSSCPSLLSKLGLGVGIYTLPSCELLMYASLGLEFSLIAGVWGSSWDFEYSDEMITGKHYQSWAGKLMMYNKDREFVFSGSSEYASHLAFDYPGQVSRVGSFIHFKKPKKSVKIANHITAFITAYTRMRMVKLMMEIGEDRLSRVVLDGLYFSGKHSAEGFVEKPSVAHTYWQSWFTSSQCASIGQIGPIVGNTCLTGAGGTGKSTAVLENKTFIDVLYVVPTHALGQKKKDESGVRYTTIHKLLGVDGDGHKIRTYVEQFGSGFGCILLDELTMIPAEWVDKMIAMFPDKLILIAGDVDEKQWFQCRSGRPGMFGSIWLPKFPCVEFKVDYRSKDEELKKFKVAMRKQMKKVFTDGGQRDSILMTSWLRKNAKICDSFEGFEAGKDIVICGTQAVNDALVSKGIISGWYNNGDWSMVEKEGFEKRGGFTCHSFQGQTIKSGKVFITLDTFEYAMLYTAASRVCTMDQLVFVDNKLAFSRK